MNARTRITITAVAALVGAAPSLFGQDRELEARESYSYVRTLDGRATLASQGSAPGEEATVNQPLVTGDRVAVASGARVELALADRNLVRVGGGSVLVLTRVAFSGDRGDRSTLLDLEDGEVVLTVTEDALGDELPEVRTPAAQVVVHRPGTYRISTAPEGWTEVVVREGFAEVVTGEGSTLVREAESAYVAGSRRGADLAEAGPSDALERWGDELAAGARQAELYVEPELGYQAAPLADYGSWVSVNSAWYWQPRVAVGWRPYWNGRWGWTPSGLTWISAEPWGWMPYHYGSWSSMPGYGWLWRPGSLYSPAWVYWHWSDDWVGWCPTGYYTNWYGPWGYGYGHGYGYGYGFRCGIYGWSSGNWGYYNDWNFAPNYCLRRRDQGRHHRRGGDLGRELGGRVPRGVVTTDTRWLDRDRLRERGFASAELARRAKLSSQADLADVTDFVARKRDLPRQVSDVIRSEPGARVRLAEVPEAGDGQPRAGVRGRGDSNTNANADTRGRRGDGQSGDGDGNGRVFARPRGDGDAGTTVTRPRTLPPGSGDTNPRVVPQPRTAPRGDGEAGGGATVTRPRTLPPASGDTNPRVVPQSRTAPRGDGEAGGGATVTRPRTLPPASGDTNPRVVPQSRTAPRGDGEAGGGTTVTRPRTLPPASGDTNPRVVPQSRTAPRGDGEAGGSTSVTRPRSLPPASGDTNPRVVPQPRTEGRSDAGRMRPGGTVEIDSNGRVRPFTSSSGDANRGSVSRSAPDTRSGAADRQGWRSLESWSGSSERSMRSPAQSGGYVPQARRDEPVQRVLGGIRSGGTGGSDRARPSPSYGPRTSGDGVSRPGAPRTTGPSYQRPTAPRSSGPSYQRPTAPPSSGAPGVRSTPRSGGSSASPSRPPSGDSSSRSGSSARSGSSSRSGSSASSPSRGSSGGSRSGDGGSRGSSRGPSSSPRRSGGG